MVRTLRPWRETTARPFDDLYKEMDSLVHHLFGENTKSNGCYAPRVDLVETETAYEVTLDLPGVNSEDISVELDDDKLTISGKRIQEEKTDDKTFHRVERSYGEFSRVITLPEPLNEENIEADYTDGVLKVLLPKTEKLKPTRIAIKTASNN